MSIVWVASRELGNRTFFFFLSLFCRIGRISKTYGRLGFLEDKLAFSSHLHGRGDLTASVVDKVQCPKVEAMTQWPSVPVFPACLPS